MRSWTYHYHCRPRRPWDMRMFRPYYDIPTFEPWGVNHEPESKSRSGTHGPIWPICYCIFACIKKRVAVRCRKLERQAVRTSILTNNTRHRLSACGNQFWLIIQEADEREESVELCSSSTGNDETRSWNRQFQAPNQITFLHFCCSHSFNNPV